MLLLEHLFIQETFFLECHRVCILVGKVLLISLCSILYMCIHLYVQVDITVSVVVLVGTLYYLLCLNTKGLYYIDLE